MIGAYTLLVKGVELVYCASYVSVNNWESSVCVALEGGSDKSTVNDACDSPTKLSKIDSGRTMDLSLTDALSESVPQTAAEPLVQMDFMSALEAESFDDKVGETVGKTDYRPLLDTDGKREAGGQTPAGRQEPLGEVWSHQTEQQVFNTDFLSGPASMAGFPGQWGTQPLVPQMKDSGPTDAFTGFSQPAMSMMDMGVAPLLTARPPSVAEPQQPPLLFATEPPKQAQTPNKADEQSPMSAALNILNALDAATDQDDPWAGEGGQQTDLPFTPSVSTVINQMSEESPELLSPTDSCEQSAGTGEERGSEGGGDRRQKKKKKRRPRDEVYDLLEPEALEGEMKSLVDSDLQWEYGDGGRVGGRVKKGKSRKRIPEEWSNPQEATPPAPASPPQDALLAEPWSVGAPSKESPTPDVCPSLSPEVPMSPAQDLLVSVTDAPAAGPASTLSAEPAPPLSSLPPTHVLDFLDEALPPSPESEAEKDLSVIDSKESTQVDAPVIPIPSLSRESSSASPRPPSPSEKAAPAPAPSHMATADVDGKYSPPLAAEDDLLVSANHGQPLSPSPAPVVCPSSPTPPAVSSLPQPSALPPAVTSALNPAAPPFFPSLSQFKEPQLEGENEDKGLAEHSMPEGW
ncbi:hypothetical protein MATL_G00256490 [Megalops atlanticus]|uniref:Microtubule-associated protein 4 n=1 Tax=Megalops atlanticus TaxID=7932 RepID=A0A9D3PEI5_MEGAT|nr:hypothetical protein MATL_G00256490 [Megalops atlanticus]